VLHDLVILDAPDVDERPGHFDASRLGTREQRHRRCSVHASQSHVVRYELALGDEVVVLDFAVAKVMADGVEDLPQSFSTLRPSGVVDHVLGHELVEDMVVSGELSSEELLYHCLRFCHPPIVPAMRPRGHAFTAPERTAEAPITPDRGHAEVPFRVARSRR
jgi:hypothetical protein